MMGRKLHAVAMYLIGTVAAAAKTAPRLVMPEDRKIGSEATIFFIYPASPALNPLTQKWARARLTDCGRDGWETHRHQ